MQNYSKAIAAFITSALALLGAAGVDIPAWTTAEWAGAVATVLNPILVYAVTNRPAAPRIGPTTFRSSGLASVAALALVALALSGCSGLSGSGGSITFRKQGPSWMTNFIDAGSPYCNGPNVPIEVSLGARVVRARALVDDVGRPGYGFKYGPQIDALDAAVTKAEAQIAETPDEFLAERLFNEPQLLLLDLAGEVIDNEHNFLFGIPDPFSAFDEARAKGIPLAIGQVQVSQKVAKYCADAGYSLSDPGNVG